MRSSIGAAGRASSLPDPNAHPAFNLHANGFLTKCGIDSANVLLVGGAHVERKRNARRYDVRTAGFYAHLPDRCHSASQRSRRRFNRQHKFGCRTERI